MLSAEVKSIEYHKRQVLEARKNYVLYLSYLKGELEAVLCGLYKNMDCNIIKVHNNLLKDDTNQYYYKTKDTLRHIIENYYNNSNSITKLKELIKELSVRTAEVEAGIK